MLGSDSFQRKARPVVDNFENNAAGTLDPTIRILAPWARCETTCFTEFSTRD